MRSARQQGSKWKQRYTTLKDTGNMYALSNQTFSRTKAGDHPQSLERKHSRVTNAGATSNGTGDVTIMDSRISSREDKREKNAITHPRKKNSSSRQKDNAFDERKSKISGVDEPKPSIMQAAAKSPVAKNVARRNDHQFDTVHDSTKQLSPTYTSMATVKTGSIGVKTGKTSAAETSHEASKMHDERALMLPQQSHRLCKEKRKNRISSNYVKPGIPRNPMQEHTLVPLPLVRLQSPDPWKRHVDSFLSFLKDPINAIKRHLRWRHRKMHQLRLHELKVRLILNPKYCHACRIKPGTLPTSSTNSWWPTHLFLSMLTQVTITLMVARVLERPKRRGIIFLLG